MQDDAIERLETKLAYLETANAELSDVVYRQQQEIDALRVRMSALVDQVEHWRSQSATWTAVEEKPPHY
jgi:SlyX protein